MNQFALKIGPKTKILNTFRRVFRFKIFEEFLIGRIEKGSSRWFWERLVPHNYLYGKYSLRYAERAGIMYDLDISDTMEHATFFGYKDPSLERLFQLASSKDLLIDVGANLGKVSMTFARICPNAKVFAFEPDPKNYEKAKRNLNLNKFSNITLINKGLGAEPAFVKLYRVNESNEGMNRILERDDIDSGLSFEEVEIVKLDDFVKCNDLGKVDLIKIDVEGYELKVLRGAAAALKRDHPTLFVELDDANLRAQNDSAEDLISFVEQLGYEVSRAEDGKVLDKERDDFTGCHFDVVCRVAPTPADTRQ
jgi:FkbM family methyltransferase